MSRDISLVLQWPNGASLSVRTSALSTPISLLSIGQFRPAVLTLNGRILDGWFSLASQGVHTGDTLVVLERAQEPQMRTTPFAAKTEAILLEVLKIKDACYRPLESSRDGDLIYGKLADDVETDPWDEFLLPPDETVIGKPRLGTGPLPALIEEDAGDEDEFTDDPGPPMFESVEEARKFFSKNPWDGWVW
jgi:hypothetical protein